MSEAYHRWLNNLSFWEQVDRFFNPSKYSCSTLNAVPDWVNWMLLVLMGICIGVFVLLLWLKYRVEVSG